MFLRKQNAIDFIDLISLFLSLVKAGLSPSSSVLLQNPTDPVFQHVRSGEGKPWQLVVASPHPHCSSGFRDQCLRDVYYIALKLHIKVCHGRATNVR